MREKLKPEFNLGFLGSPKRPSSSMESPPEQEKMDVYLKMIKTVAFKVNKSSKIKDLKSSFYKKEGVEKNLQELFYNGQHLKDEEKLADHGIRSNSTLNLYVRGDSTKLFVKIPPDDKNVHHRTIVLELTICDTLENIKCLIGAKEGIQTDSYALFYNAKQLEDNRTLASLNIPNESVLRMVLTPSDSMSVSVELPSGEVLILEVKYMHRILDLKEIILSREPLLASGHDLSYEGKRLDDDHKTLAFYDIKPNSTLQVVPSTFQIYVKDGRSHVSSGKATDIVLDLKNERSHVFSVKATDTVLGLKKLISDRLEIPCGAFYSLSYGGRYLLNNQNLATYGLSESSTVDLGPSLLLK